MKTADEPSPMRVLLIGPLPPPLGGTTVMFTQLVQELSNHPGIGISRNNFV